jgi:hypothetical protein
MLLLPNSLNSSINQRIMVYDMAKLANFKIRGTAFPGKGFQFSNPQRHLLPVTFDVPSCFRLTRGTYTRNMLCQPLVQRDETNANEASNLRTTLRIPRDVNFVCFVLEKTKKPRAVQCFSTSWQQEPELTRRPHTRDSSMFIPFMGGKAFHSGLSRSFQGIKLEIAPRQGKPNIWTAEGWE